MCPNPICSNNASGAAAVPSSRCKGYMLDKTAF